MTHDVRDQCKTCGDWYWKGDEHTCSRTASADFLTDAVLTAAFPTHPLVDEAAGAEFEADVLAGRQFRLALEAFDLDVERVMWEQNVGRRTAVHVVEASRRLDARKAELRAARAAA